jgi:RHS repeat-associated protein
MNYHITTLLSTIDYYPFGQEMPGRNFSVSRYKFGFNGKEKLDEANGEGNIYDYGFRIYNTQLGKFLSIDPLTKNYPMLSSYQFASNCSIAGIDLDGLEFYYMADGTCAGQIGTNTEVRLINNKITLEDAQATITFANQYLKTAENEDQNVAGLKIYSFDSQMADAAKMVMDNNSSDVGMTNDELNTRATLATIKVAEAGESNPELDYNSWNGTDKFTSDSYEENPEKYSKHPGPNPNRKGARAAGAYQFMAQFWNGIFSPKAQDKAAVKGLKLKGALEDAKAGDIGKVKEKVKQYQWTSFAIWKLDKLKKIFKQKVSDELNGKSKIATSKGDLFK